MAERDLIYLPVWPYFFLAGLAFGVAMWILVAWMPPWRPVQGDLVKLEGAITRTEVRDHISDTGAGAVWPMLTSVFFTLEGQAQEVEYPYTHPRYIMARDNTSGALRVWVDKGEIGTGKPMMIWQLEEESEHTLLYENTSILFEEIAAHLDRVGQSRHRTAVPLIFAAVGLWVLGHGVRYLNRRRGARRV